MEKSIHKSGIGLPVSQHFMDVFPVIEDIVDVLVVRDLKRFPADIDGSYRKSYHTDGLVNSQFAKEMSYEFINILNINEIYHLSFDLGPSCVDVELNNKRNDIYWPCNGSEVLAPEDILKIAGERINSIRKIFNGIISVENLDYHTGGAYEYVCEPDFIAYAVKKLNVDITIDVAHLLVTCHNLHLDPFNYISKLPLKSIREVHISHPDGDNDKHDPPTEYEYELLDYLLSESAPDFIVVEYYKNPKKIIEENIKLFNFLNSA